VIISDRLTYAFTSSLLNKIQIEVMHAFTSSRLNKMQIEVIRICIFDTETGGLECEYSATSCIRTPL
jgi:hypothetical protein